MGRWEKNLEADRAAIAEAKAGGFLDCNEVFDALGFEEINAGGIRRSKYQVASPMDRSGHWV